MKISVIVRTCKRPDFLEQALTSIQLQTHKDWEVIIFDDGDNKLNQEIVNVNGGAISLGHPLGCTGAKLTVQILEEMKLRNQKYGMVTACIGGGQGIAILLENLDA